MNQSFTVFSQNRLSLGINLMAANWMISQATNVQMMSKYKQLKLQNLIIPSSYHITVNNIHTGIEHRWIRFLSHSNRSFRWNKIILGTFRIRWDVRKPFFETRILRYELFKHRNIIILECFVSATFACLRLTKHSFQGTLLNYPEVWCISNERAFKAFDFSFWGIVTPCFWLLV